METADATDKRVGFPLLFVVVAILGAIGLAVFGFTGDQAAAGWSFAVATLFGTLAVVAYHVYGRRHA